MKTRLFLSSGAAALVAVALAVSAEDAPKTKAEAKPETTKKSGATATQSTAGSDFKVICYLEKQDCTITVKAGPKGTVYSAKRTDGKVLCENVSLEQLRAQAPELHEFIKSALVINSGKSNDARVVAPKLDARF